MNKSALIDKIKELEGLSNDEKSALLGLLRSHKKYGLVWEDKPEDVEERLKDSLPVLTEVKERAIISDSPDAPNHILIEGDNLEALTALSYTHEGKVDVIYIDPPYNTGNKDFTYNDTRVDAEDSYRHSKWLSFMEKRLRIAKRLLSDRGVIFISIDDNEQANLKLLCDEIFGENKFVGNIIWYKKRKGSFLSNKLVSLTEYLLPYYGGQIVPLFGGKPDNSESQPIIKRTNAIKELRFPANVVKTKLDDGVYPCGLYGVGTSATTVKSEVHVKSGLIINEFVLEAPFTWSQEFLNAEIANGTEVLINTNKFQVRVIRRNNDSIKAFPSFVDGREIGGTNEDAYECLKDIFNTDRPFPYSKPANFIKTIINSVLYNRPDAYVLDFFAGSGTTLQSLLQLNSEDGGCRKCIIVTNNEEDICETVTYVRSERRIKGYNNVKGERVNGFTNNSLRYYRTSLLSRERTMPNMRKLVSLATDMLCIKEDLYKEEFTFGKLKLNPQIARYFNDGKHQMLVIYREEVIRYFVDEIEKMSFDGKLKVYLFAPDRYAFDDDFFGVSDKVQLCALPAAIYDAYQKVLPKHKPRYVEIEEVETEDKEDSTMF